MIAVIAVAPLTYLTFLQLPRPSDDEDVATRRPWKTALLAVAGAFILLLAVYTLRSTVMLNYYRADTSEELLAQRTSTPTVSVFANRITNVSRDLTVSGASPADPEGGHSITIDIEQSVRSPFRWYFRDFPNVTIVENGAAGQTGADLVIVQEQAALDQANVHAAIAAVSQSRSTGVRHSLDWQCTQERLFSQSLGGRSQLPALPRWNHPARP